jgi:hypothetical protein
MSHRDLDLERGPADRSFAAELASATSYENRLAVKALIPLLIVATLILLRLFG